MEYEIEIVNHEIEHDGDIGAARLERSQPKTLDVARTVQERLRRPECAVVPLDVTHLQLHPPSLGAGDEVVRLSQRYRERLLHEHGDAHIERACANLSVGRGGHRDRNRLHLAQQIVHVAERGGAQPIGNLAGSNLVGVVDPD
jgi:hypothetical protein